MTDWHVKYRPREIAAVFGQEHIVKIVGGFNKKTCPHAFLFVGPPGVGKTTVARIIGSEILECSEWPNFIECDAGRYSGVDDMRELLADLHLKAHGKNTKKYVLLDEVHTLTDKAWKALLKTLEEPPEHVYFALCTTEDMKVPKMVKDNQRCHTLHFGLVDEENLFDLAKVVVDCEELKFTDKMVKLIVKRAYGVPRKVIVGLSNCRNCETIGEVREILKEPSEEGEGEIIDIAKAIVKNENAVKAIKLTSTLSCDVERVRIIILKYLVGCIKRSGSKGEIARFLGICQHFQQPFYNIATAKEDLILAVASSFFDVE